MTEATNPDDQGDSQIDIDVGGDDFNIVFDNDNGLSSSLGAMALGGAPGVAQSQGNFNMVFGGVPGDEGGGEDEFDFRALMGNGGSGGGQPDPFYTQRHDLRFLAQILEDPPEKGALNWDHKKKLQRLKSFEYTQTLQGSDFIN